MCFDCDSFENKKTTPKRLKIARKSNVTTDTINLKLDYIIANMGLVEPVIDSPHGTYDVTWKGQSIARFYLLSDAHEFILRYQSEFKSTLSITRVKINL